MLASFPRRSEEGRSCRKKRRGEFGRRAPSSTISRRSAPAAAAIAGTPSEAASRELLAGRLAETTGAQIAREAVRYRGWTRGPGSVSLPDGRRFPAHSLGRSPTTPAAGLTASVFDLGRGAPADFAAAGERVRGRIVLVRHEFMMGTGHIHRRKKYDAARLAGAAGFLIAFNLPGGLLVTGSSGSGGKDDIPAAGLSYEAAAALSGAKEATLETAGTFADAIAENLFADIPGRTEEMVVLSAHIDGHDLGTSAIDNGSGLAAVLAVAAAVRDIVPGLRRGLRVALFNVEEWALIGSREHLAHLPEAERRRFVFNVNLDSVAGAGRLTALTSGIPGIDGFVRRIAAETGISLGTYGTFMGNSDHANYIANGIPALRLCAGFDEPQSNIRFLLTAADTPDKVAASELKTAATAAAALVLAACAGDRPPASPLTAEEVKRITGG